MEKMTETDPKIIKVLNIKKIKCKNINVNVNEIEPNVISFSFLSGITAADDADASEGKYCAVSYGSGGGSYGNGGSYGAPSGSDNDFEFVCINNNNNTVVVEEPPELLPCEENFENF